MAEATIVFADLTGSTGLFEALGNQKAADVVTRATQWIGKLCTLRGGRVIKYLGDGVLMSFADNAAAVLTMVEMQRLHHERITTWPENIRMKIKVGLARGPIVEQDGDCFGDAVNLAARLSDLAGAEQILVSHSVMSPLSSEPSLRSRNLGAMEIRGKAEPVIVHRIEWQGEVASEFLTVPAALEPADKGSDGPASQLTLHYLDTQRTFYAEDFPISIGRGAELHFSVNDPRVSRLHAQIARRGDHFVLEDLSSYGSSVRFAGHDTVISLRRQECVLLGSGELALGASFDDFSAPCIAFQFGADSAV